MKWQYLWLKFWGKELKSKLFFFPESIYVMNVVTVKYFKRQFQQLQGITCKEITRFVNEANCLPKFELQGSLPIEKLHVFFSSCYY